jgi:hypothetical protein
MVAMTVVYPLDKSRDVDRKWVQRLHRERPDFLRERMTTVITRDHNVRAEKGGRGMPQGAAWEAFPTKKYCRN